MNVSMLTYVIFGNVQVVQVLHIGSRNSIHHTHLIFSHLALSTSTLRFSEEGSP